jgi:SAM-dependent methyltransferase
MGQVKPEPAPFADGGLRAAYQAYFLSGHYDRRYPRPNLTTWRRILARVTPDTHLLDFGCGSGRYLLPLRKHVARAVGFDICPAALALLRTRSEVAGPPEVKIIGPEATDVPDYVAHDGPFDLVICLFGVLGHIADAGERHAALEQMRTSLVPGTGRLLISVPNKARRFFAEQRAAGPAADDLIYYERHLGDTHLDLPYQLYDPARLQRELVAAGYSVSSLKAESVLPESWLLNNWIARWLDRCLTPLCPARWGYGLIAEARP